MKKLLIGLTLLTSISSFASSNYLCHTEKGISNAVLIVEESDTTSKLYDMYKSKIDGATDYLNSFSADYERIAPYFGDEDNTYSVKPTREGTEFYTTVKGRFFGTNEVTIFLIDKNLNGAAESCSSGILQGNNCSVDNYNCEEISEERANSYLELK